MADIVIRMRDNGPFVVEGAFTLNDADGNSFSLPTNKPAVALCRCGNSKNKPFCDGSHKECSFDSAERAPTE